MANKIVILRKGLSEGPEYPLDVDTGTTLRGICHEGGGNFWLTCNPNLVKKYRLDVAGGNAKNISSDNFATTGSDSDIWGIATDGLDLLLAMHNLRTGVHHNFIRKYNKRGVSVEDLADFDSSAVDLGQRIKDLDFQIENVHFTYESGGIPANQSKRAVRAQAPLASVYQTTTLGNLNISGLVVDSQGDGFWTVGSDSILKQFMPDGTLKDQFTITNSGTPRSMCNYEDGCLAIAMT